MLGADVQVLGLADVPDYLRVSSVVSTAMSDGQTAVRSPEPAHWSRELTSAGPGRFT